MKLFIIIIINFEQNVDELSHKVSTSCLKICRQVVLNCSVDELSRFRKAYRWAVGDPTLCASLQ